MFTYLFQRQTEIGLVFKWLQQLQVDQAKEAVKNSVLLHLSFLLK